MLRSVFERSVFLPEIHMSSYASLIHILTGRLCGFLFYGKRYGAYVVGLYVVIKVLFLFNVIGQFFLLNSFLGFPDHRLWGFEVLRDLAIGREWPESGHFPRVTMCDFEVRLKAKNLKLYKYIYEIEIVC